MKRFAIFVKKEFYHIFRDKRTLLILFGMPVVQVILFGFAITNEIKDANIVILDPSKDEATREISDKLLSSGYFRLSENLQTPGQIEEIFKEGKVKLAVLFAPNFNQNLWKEGKAQVQLVADATDPNTATLLVNYASAIINSYQRSLLLTQQMPLTIQTEVKMHYNPALEGVFMFVPGVMTIILMLVSAMMTSIAVTREKELGTMEVLLVSPIQPPLIVIGKVIPYLLLSIINATVIVLLGKFVFGMPIVGSLVLLAGECILFVITSLSLGILISTVTDSQQTALLISLMALMLPTIILSGFIFPIENMPVILQWLSHIIPARWFIEIIKGIMLKGVGLGYLWPQTMILIGMTLFFILMSIKRFRVRLE